MEDLWAAEFVHSEFALKGRATEGIDFRALRDPHDHSLTALGVGSMAARVAGAIRAVLAQAKRPATMAGVDASFLIELHRLLTGNHGDAGRFRDEGGTALFAGHEPAAASIVPRLFHMTTDWTAEPSFRELHPVEQAVLLHARLADLQPFAGLNDTIARLAASSLTVREGYAPLIFAETDRDRYHEAVGRALLMQTQPCVELFAEVLGRAFQQVLEQRK